MIRFSHSIGVHKSEIKLIVGLPSLQRPKKDSVPSILQILVAVSIPWPVATSLQSSLGFSLCVSDLPLSDS